MNFESEHPSSLPCSLHSTTAGRRLKHQNGTRILTLGFDQTASAGAASLFITGQQDGDWRPRARFGRLASEQYFQRERAIRFHIENSRYVVAISFRAPRSFFDCSARMDRIGVPQNHDRRRVVIREGFDAQVLPELFTGYALNRTDRIDAAGSV